MKAIIYKFLILTTLLTGFVYSTEDFPKIVAFLGSKRVGKDTSADFLVRAYGYKKYPLADPLKKALQLLFHFTDEQLWGDDKESMDPYWQVSPREVMQFMGIDVLSKQLPQRFSPIKNNGKSFHIRLFELEVLKYPEERWVISDLRMQEDLVALKEMGAVILKLSRPGVSHNDAHISEQAVSSVVGYDYDVINNGSIDQLEKQISKILLQESLEISMDEEMASQLFELAVTQARQYDRQWVEDKLNLILTGQFQSLTPGEIKRLKKERIFLARLRNAYKMLSKTHEPPRNLAEFEECLGDLNDALANQLPETILSFAKKLLPKLAVNVIEEAVEKFEPTSKESFHSLTRHLLEHLGELVQQTEMAIAIFHEIRWTLKYFMTLFQLSEHIESHSSRKLALENLEKNNEIMGEIHDRAVAADMRGEIRYQDYVVELPETVRQTVLELKLALAQ